MARRQAKNDPKARRPAKAGNRTWDLMVKGSCGDKTAGTLFFSAPGRAHTLEAKVLSRPGQGNCWPDGKGVHREVESEGSRRQDPGPTRRKCMRRARGVRRPISLKPGSDTDEMQLSILSSKIWLESNNPSASLLVTFPISINCYCKFVRIRQLFHFDCSCICFAERISGN
jgi:hypothetical protein